MPASRAPGPVHLRRLLLVMALLLVAPAALPGEKAGEKPGEKAGEREAERIAVIVHAERGVSLDLEAVAQIFLKRRRYWAGGDAIVPINREAGSALRAGFERSVLALDAAGLALYWNREYFRGVLPPATLASDEAVLRFVAADRRAIGYVSAARVDGSVRVVLYLD